MSTLTHNELRQALKTLIEKGLTFSTCVSAFGPQTSDEREYIREARLLYAREGSVEIDDTAVVSMGGDMGAYVMAWVWVDDVSIWAGAVDSDGEPCRCINHYHCDNCDTEWEDNWSCACNDHCPKCNREIEPYETQDLDLLGNLITAEATERDVTTVVNEPIDERSHGA